MNLKKRSLIAPAPLQGMPIMEGNENGTAMSEREPSIYFTDGSRKGSKAFSAGGDQDEDKQQKQDPVDFIGNIAIGYR